MQPLTPSQRDALLRPHVDEDNPWQSPHFESVADILTPARLAGLMREANEGITESYLTLAEEMEERESHYRSVLFTRRAVISQLQPEVEAVDDSDLQQRIAADVQELADADEFASLLFDMLDALNKGYSVNEVMWESSEKSWWPSGYKWRDPRWYRVNYHTLRGLQLQDGSSEGKPLPPGKYIVHHPHLKSGVPIRGGLARVGAVAFMCKSYTVRDLMRFLEVYGMPVRLGKHPDEASDELKNNLLRSLRRIGTDAAAVVPKSMDVEFLETTGSTSSDAFLGTADYWDRQTSKAVLGQTSSSDGSAGDYKASQQHQGVRMDYAQHDARQVMASVASQLFRLFIDFNYGAQERYPKARLPVPIPEDLTKYTAAVAPLIDRGLEVSARQMYDKLGLSAPKEGEVLLRPAVKRDGAEAGPAGDTPGETAPDPDSVE